MNLGVISYGPRDMTTYYRAEGVLAYLRKYGVRLIVSDGWHYQKLMELDALFMQRPCTDAHLQVARMCKEVNVPLWLDYDDDQFCLNRSNPFYSEFMQPGVHENMRQLAGLATVISVSTEALKQRYPNATVIPNALNDHVWKFQDRTPKRVITWRGGGSHHADLEPFLPALARVANDHADWDWHFFGCPHWEIENAIPNDQLHRHDFKDIFAYMREFESVSPAIHIVPLADNRFNRCKSNCAWLEATWAGACVLAPDWYEWNMAGVTNYASVEDFEIKLRSLIGRWNDLALWSASSTEISKWLLLSEVNRQRAELLHSLGCPVAIEQ